MRSHSTTIIWFRDDLRIHDHPALFRALAHGDQVIGLFIGQTKHPHEDTIATDWWLHYALLDLARSLRKIAVPLIIRKGPAQDILKEVIRQTGANRIFWSRRYLSWEIREDRALKSALRLQGINAQSFNAKCLLEPWQNNRDDPVLSPYRSAKDGFLPIQNYTAYLNRLQEKADHIAKPLPAPIAQKKAHFEPLDEQLSTGQIESLTLEDLDLRPIMPDWACLFDQAWQVKEQYALDKILAPQSQAAPRDFLLPFMRFGQLSPRMVWHQLRAQSPSPDFGFLFLFEYAWHYNYGRVFQPANTHHPHTKCPFLGPEAESETLSLLIAHLWQYGFLSIHALQALMMAYSERSHHSEPIFDHLLVYADPALLQTMRDGRLGSRDPVSMTDLELHLDLLHPDMAVSHI